METASLDRLIETLLRDLKRLYLADVDRLNHIYGVRDTALRLAKIHRLDNRKVLLASYLHDMTKAEDEAFHAHIITRVYDASVLETTPPPLWHAYSAAALARTRYGVNDEDVLRAVESHTVGRAAMSTLEAVLFISDYIEPNRLYPSCVAAREMAFIDLNKAVHYAIDRSIRFHERKGFLVPEAAYEARNHYERSMR